MHKQGFFFFYSLPPLKNSLINNFHVAYMKRTKNLARHLWGLHVNPAAGAEEAGSVTLKGTPNTLNP